MRFNQENTSYVIASTNMLIVDVLKFLFIVYFLHVHICGVVCYCMHVHVLMPW